MKRFTIIFTAAVLATLASCASQPTERQMNSFGSALTKLSAAVDATARYKRAADGLNGVQLLNFATAHDPGLLTPFDGLSIRASRMGGSSAVLICRAEGKDALLEDSGCTATLDSHRWRMMGNHRCEFTLDIQQLCAR